METIVLDGKAFWARIKELCNQRNVKQSDVCAVTDLKYENFKNQSWMGNILSTRNVYAIAKFFGVTMEYLLTGESENHLVERNIELEKRVAKLENFKAQIQAAMN